jgi:CheY-like chemotaxis protein
MDTPPPTYVVSCFHCQGAFDAMETTWCSCLVTERTLVCSICFECFCKATPAYKQKFWSAAPRQLWEKKFKEHHEPYEPAENPKPSDVTRPLVLLVDDEKDIQRVATKVIGSLGYSMVLAKNGEEGLQMAKIYKPDLVLSDALMPKMDGREMCRRIKSDPETENIKVVVMTALYTNVKYKTEAYRNFRVDDYLSKPLDFASLREVLQKHLG